MSAGRVLGRETSKGYIYRSLRPVGLFAWVNERVGYQGFGKWGMLSFLIDH
jgi:hypothetical protein